MLLPQIADSHKKKVATEFGVDLKVFSAKRTTEQDEGEDRIARMETVVNYILEFGNVGTIAAPDQYINDSLPMYSVLRHNGVYFTGKQLSTFVGIGGSSRHLLVAKSMPDESSNSFTSAILGMLSHDTERVRDEDSRNDFGLGAIMGYHAHLAKRGLPLENFRFLAKRLIERDYDTEPKSKVLLCTPLYIALDD